MGGGRIEGRRRFFQSELGCAPEALTPSIRNLDRLDRRRCCCPAVRVAGARANACQCSASYANNFATTLAPLSFVLLQHRLSRCSQGRALRVFPKHLLRRSLVFFESCTRNDRSSKALVTVCQHFISGQSETSYRAYVHTCSC